MELWRVHGEVTEMPKYIVVPAEDIEGFLRSKGFSRTVQCQEVVYVRRHEKDCNVVIKVYTSIATGAAAARKSGADSVKICTVWDDGGRSFGIGKFPRVHRTGSPEAVLHRVYARMREAYARGTEWIREQVEKGGERRERRERVAEFAGFRSDPDFQERIIQA